MVSSVRVFHVSTMREWFLLCVCFTLALCVNGFHCVRTVWASALNIFRNTDQAQNNAQIACRLNSENDLLTVVFVR